MTRTPLRALTVRAFAMRLATSRELLAIPIAIVIAFVVGGVLMALWLPRRRAGSTDTAAGAKGSGATPVTPG